MKHPASALNVSRPMSLLTASLAAGPPLTPRPGRRRRHALGDAAAKLFGFLDGTGGEDCRCRRRVFGRYHHGVFGRRQWHAQDHHHRLLVYPLPSPPPPSSCRCSATPAARRFNPLRRSSDATGRLRTDDPPICDQAAIGIGDPETNSALVLFTVVAALTIPLGTWYAIPPGIFLHALFVAAAKKDPLFWDVFRRAFLYRHFYQG